MYTLILVILFIALAVYSLYRHRTKLYEQSVHNKHGRRKVQVRPSLGEYTFIAGLVTFFIVIMTMFAVTMANESKEWLEYNEYETSLVAMQDNITTTGKFFLGSGSLNGEARYFYYYETDNGMRQSSVPVHEAYVIQTERDDGKLIRFESKPNFPRWNTFRFHGGGHTYYEFHVPEGTVVESFNLDLE